MVVWIVGFPHTATTYAYRVLRGVFGFGVFEPFNPFVRLDYAARGWHRHYSEGLVDDDFDKLPHEAKHHADIVSMAFLASTWCRLPTYLSVIERSVLDFAKAVRGVQGVVKDVSVWWLLLRSDVVRNLGTVFVLVRDRDAVWRDFKMVLTREKDESVRHPCHLAGLGLFAQALGIKVPRWCRLAPIRCARKLFDKLYSTYVEMANRAEDAGAVVLRFGKLSEDSLVNALKRLTRA